LKNLHRIIAAISLAAILFSCNQKKTEKDQVQIISDTTNDKKQIEVRYLGEFISRRSYAKLQTPEFYNKSEKEIDKYLKEEKNSNPLIIWLSDSNLIAHFKRLGLIKKDEFLQDNFKYSKKELFEYADSTGKIYKIKLTRSKTNSPAKLTVYSATDSIVIDTKKYFFPEFKFAIIDFVPGGNKELVLLDEYYISNGDNSDLIVYEIITD
jgi:hypothetical protein